MSNTINTSVSVGKLNFTFTDEDGNAFSSFRMNPADFSIAARCSEVSEYFSKHEDISGESIEGVLLFNKELEEKICYILGMMQEIVFLGRFRLQRFSRMETCLQWLFWIQSQKLSSLNPKSVLKSPMTR